jgi:tRNA (adenine57-N1/adenine58-N1)-methyltransferase catalytic subunit
MSWISASTTAQDGDLVLLIGLKQRYFIFPLSTGGVFQTHRGVIKHNEIIGQKWGSEIYSHNDSPFYLFQPGIEELIKTTKRNTQIMYAKDIGYILLKLNIINGAKVIEAGTGSGSLTQVIAAIVGDEGHLYSYEQHSETQNLAKKNLKRLAIQNRVSFIEKDIREGFDQNSIDAIFLDVPNPYDYLDNVKRALVPGGFFGSLLPTTNQVVKLLNEMRRKRFASVEVSEIMLRYYQAEETKLRPTDRMVAHTGYLIFGRPVNVSSVSN